MFNVFKSLAVVLSLVGCSAPVEGTASDPALDTVPAGEQAQPANPVPSVPVRACGCADMTAYTIPAGGCFAVAYGVWGQVEDDIVCFDLTPDDNKCTRTCAGYLEIKNTTNAAIKINAFDKLTSIKPGHAQPGLETCDAMLNGPSGTAGYVNPDPFAAGPAGLSVRYKGGPTASTFPAPGLSVCPL